MTATAEMLQQTLDRHADQIAAQIGADPGQTRAAISAALPALIAGLQHQAGTGTGLQQAIETDHDGKILDDVPGYLAGTAQLSPRTTDGSGILEHLLGDQQPAVQQAVSDRSGLDLGGIARLLPILAPIVMGLIGRQARSTGSSSGGLGDLGSILGSLAGGSASGTGTGGLGDILSAVLGSSRNR